MNVVAQQTSSAIADVREPTKAAFLELLKQNRSQIESTIKETFKYGATSRHQLDVYYPQLDGNLKPSILLFSYGGGLVSGDRVLPDTDGLVYANTGAFFAKHGYLTVIADYRLVSSGAIYPEPLEDVRDALAWIVGNLSHEGNTDKIYIMGHSAGALVQSSLLLHPSLLSQGLRSRIKGAILNGGAYHFNATPENPSLPSTVHTSYFGPGDAHKSKSSLGLLADAPATLVANLPPLLIVTAEKEPKSILRMKEDFVALLKERKVPSVTEYDNKGHNHISSTIALSSGEGEEWGLAVVEWLNTH